VYKKLFTPQSIGKLQIPNRLVVPAMVSNFSTADGLATERYIAYHEAKAKGGWGLIITEDYAVAPTAKGYRFIGGLYDDEHVQSQKALPERIHQYATKIVAQIYHAGRQTNFGKAGVQPVAPSAIPCPWCRDLPRELTAAEIKQIVALFGDTAARVKKAGFDGVEIHGAHGYLIAEFMSTYTNKRTDEYGGCLQNRLRFPREVIEDVRAKVGPDFPILFRISADEVRPGGREISETRVIARTLESWGVDALHVSSGVYGNHGIVSPMVIPHAWTAGLAEEVKKIVSIPVITVNRINDPQMADLLLEMGKADFVAMGRGSLADPELPNKARAGDFSGIRYCIGCMEGCTGKAGRDDAPICCAVNPTLGHEFETNLEKAPVAKKVFIAGGGPAGMEAARAAGLKGHQVDVYEKRDFLGGQFKSAAYPPFKGELATLTAWQINELKKLPNVRVHLQSELTPELIQAEKPDVVIVATGATPIIPDLPGIQRPNVCTAEDVLLGKVATGNNVFIAGGGSVGVETAAHIALQLKQVTVADMLPMLCADESEDSIRLAFLAVLNQNGVTQLTNSKVIEICEKGVLLEKFGSTTLYPCDTVVLAFGYRKNDALAEKLSGLAEKVVVVGDATGSGQIMDATRSGFVAGLEA
jgi:2,4-dienoyl-CoA reductase-like NADH-dependent reductase (Old Yellow Enzyme family)/thioredoxin reductase